MAESNPAATVASGLLPEPLRAVAGAAHAGLAHGDARPAERALAQLRQAAPGHPDTLRLEAALLTRGGRHAEAAARLRAALAQRPADVALLNALGVALDRGGAHADAAAVLRDAATRAPGVAAVWANLGRSLGDAGDVPAAIAALERALALDPGLIPTRFTLAYVHRIAGNDEAAAHDYREILARRPEDGDAWLGLADLAAGALEDADVASMKAALAHADPARRETAALGFALAAALDAKGSFADAFAVLAEANRRMHRLEPWNAVAASTRCDAVLAACDRPLPCAPGQHGAGGIFIVGMPRSGSTLVEQVLAAHPDVSGGGERGDIPAILGAESRRRGVPFPNWVAKATANDWQRLGSDYVARIRAARGDAKFVTDKLPGNWLHVGVIRAMLPGARIIVCRRDPLENLFACWRRQFAPGRQAWSYDIDDLVAEWRDFDRTIRSWVRHFAGEVREQSIERLSGEPEAEIRALLDFCGLPFDAACLAPHAAERLVRTVSAGQVRKPIAPMRRRVPDYGNLLDPWRAALGPGNAPV